MTLDYLLPFGGPMNRNEMRPDYLRDEQAGAFRANFDIINAIDRLEIQTASLDLVFDFNFFNEQPCSIDAYDEIRRLIERDYIIIGEEMPAVIWIVGEDGAVFTDSSGVIAQLGVDLGQALRHRLAGEYGREIGRYSGDYERKLGNAVDHIARRIFNQER